MEDISKRLRTMRKRCNLTQESLSEHLGYTPAYYGQLERGDRKISFRALCTIANFYEVSPDYLATGMDSGSLEPLTQFRETADYSVDVPYTERITLLLKTATEDECKFCYGIVREALTAYRNTIKEV